MTRVLVTGAAGFIGSHLVRRLSQEGYKVRAAVRRLDSSVSFPLDVDVVEGDVRAPAMKMAATGCEMIIHLAGKAHAVRERRDSEQDYAAINVEGTRNVLDGAASAGVRRVILASSVKVFGEGTTTCVDESAPPAPQTPYGRSKWTAEQLLLEYGTKFQFDTLSLRLPIVYGPTEKGNLYRMLAAIDRGWFPPLSRVDNRRSMLHIDNLLQAIQLSLTTDVVPRPCYIVADAAPYSVATIYDALRRGLGRRAPRWRVPLWTLRLVARCGDLIEAGVGVPVPFNGPALEKLVGSAWYSAKAIAQDLEYRPTLSFGDAVPGLIAAYRAGRG